jgi:copper oxidase (laccase) domain-containing protein
MLPLAVGTADCLPIVIEGRTSVAVVHAGWRGLAAGVVESALEAMIGAGDAPLRAAIGPAIGPCCYEVGGDVTDRFPGFEARTTWGAPSVDLKGAASVKLAGLELWVSPRCTMTDPELWSHRGAGTRLRQVAVAWVPGS